MPFPGVDVLAPPYAFPAPLTPAAPPLGALLIADMAGAQGVEDAVTRAHQGAPWCPVCLLLSPRPMDAGLLECVQGLPKHLVYVTRHLPGDPPNVDAIVYAVAHRPPPSAADLAGYVARRTRNRRLGEALVACFRAYMGQGGPTSALRSWLSRQLAPCGSLTGRDWGAIVTTLPVLRSGPFGLDRFAYELGLDPRTVRARLRRYAGMSMTEAGQCIGWEWFLETVLRRWGYVEAPDGLADSRNIRAATSF